MTLVRQPKDDKTTVLHQRRRWREERCSMSLRGFREGNRMLGAMGVLRRIGLQGITLLTILVLVASIVAVPNAIAQDNEDTTQTSEEEAELEATPAPGDDEGDNQAADEATPTTDEEANQESASAGESSLEPGHPAVVSQGLALLTGDQAVWQVREIEISGDQAEAGAAAHVLQRDGETIIRNDVTAKRALIEPGEAYFRAGDDPYTFTSEGGDATVWMFEIVDPDDVADDAFYESPLIDQYDEGIYDSELIRFELDPGDEFDLPSHTGPALLMVTAGEVDVEDERGLGLLADGQGQLIGGDGMVRNSGSEPASFVFAALGASVDEGAGATAAEEEPDATTDAEDEDENAAANAEEDTLAEEETGDTTEAAAEEPAASGEGGFTATINVTAQEDLTLTIVADGIEVFNGPLPAGSSSGAVAGSTFEVTTSSGVNTVFTNACGDEFVMGYDEGPATYTLNADASSCG